VFLAQLFKLDSVNTVDAERAREFRRASLLMMAEGLAVHLLQQIQVRRLASHRARNRL
jgi:hypothetical protein